MAVGLDFLSKTSKLGGMKDIMGASAPKSVPNQSQNVSSALAGQDAKKSDKAQKPNVSDMNTSDLLKYVYNNKGTNNNDIKLPYRVEYGDQEFPLNGKNFDDMVKEICKQTGDSKSRVETELKKKYAGGGGSLNMQA